ncbi:MAG: acetylglutamate kinase [Candidatus Methanoplasma sp.]|jgi:acetylglutamate kinase|nr:acetylglutamate kinase [Candidatus Methanoplasma sp.]
MDSYLVKFGGNALRGREDMLRLAAEVADAIRRRRRVVIVHGGGPEISAELDRRGIPTTKIAGVRVTDERVLEVAEEVLRGINAEMVAALEESGVRAVGMSGAMCSLCRRKPPSEAVVGGERVSVDLGLVGEVESVDSRMISDLLAEKVVPVIYPIGADGSGARLNVNADTMAAGIAAGIGCREMIAVTDVPGVLADVSDPSSKIDVLSLADADGMIADGTISGGMVPKVEACRDALAAGVARVRMVSGRDGGSMISDAIKGARRGTVIVR